ncbi:hypothetical protein [Hymenobacter glacialis]|uniref:Bacterial Pleckstrin homology domain-containing protein n=1 Tax=Hymenobacter glacialis TaxID=1908236 RepID=A0A1G1T445_9BACT|nr:hypothetical protein [Hymenobacter glacialis]OGX85634.1 hypothetical protein BEN48_02035 [Hymenobacter glacialis]
MVEVTQQGDGVLFEVQGLHKLWAFKSSLTIPRAHIAGARQDPEAARNLTGLRALGTAVPWGLKAGTFYLDGVPGPKPAFIDMVNPDQTVIIDLRDEEYQRLIIEVADPAAVVALLIAPSV